MPSNSRAYTADNGQLIHAGEDLRDVYGNIWRVAKVRPDGALVLEMELVFYGVSDRAVGVARAVVPPGAAVVHREGT